MKDGKELEILHDNDEMYILQLCKLFIIIIIIRYNKIIFYYLSKRALNFIALELGPNILTFIYMCIYLCMYALNF